MVNPARRGTMAMEAICFTHSEKLFFNKGVMKNMQRLRILCIRLDWKKFFMIPNCQDEYFWPSDCHDGSIVIPNNLCWFFWLGYPCKLLPENFNPRRLVHLDLRWSSLHQLWNETKQLPSLRRLYLCGSRRLRRTPDFTGSSKKLIALNLSYCESLERFPYVNAEMLESLDLVGCSRLEKFPKIVGIMKPELEIKMSLSGIREQPLSINHALAEIDLSKLNSLVALPSSIYKLKGLVKLHVSDCSKLESLPEEIGDLEKLRSLMPAIL